MSRLAILVVVTALDFALGLLVLTRNPRNWVNRSFALFAMSVACWSASQVANLLGAEPAVFWARWSFLMGGMTVLGLVLFFHTFPFDNKLPRTKTFIAIAASAAVVSLLSTFSPWIVASASNTSRGRVPTYGHLYPVFAIYVFACIGYSLALIVSRTRSARGAERQQLSYLFIALLVPGLLGISTNLIIPLLTHSSQFSQYGPLFSVLMVAMIAHAIIRYRFMNVRLIFRRGVVYLMATIIAGASLIGMLLAADKVTGGSADDAPLEVQVIVGLIVAIAFRPLKDRIQTWLDHYVYRETYDYQKTIRNASRTIASILDLRSVLNYLCDITGRTFRPDLAIILTRDPDSGVFEVAKAAAYGSFAEGGGREFHRSPLTPTSPLPLFLARSRRYLLLNEQRRVGFKPDLDQAEYHLRELGGELALPMFSETELTGFLVLGPKLSGDAYFSEDVELLSTLVSQAAIAVKNAQLYRQVVLVNDYIENILSTMDSGVITVDAHGKVALANATAERLTGLPRSTLTSMTVAQLSHSIAGPLGATLSDGKPRSQVEGILSSEGDRQTPIVCSTSALRSDRNSVVGALVVFNDLTQVKALESEKQRAERLAAFGSLVSGIAHEIKNPLVAIKTFAELLPERFLDTDFREDFSKVVGTEIDRIDGLVGRLRSLAAPVPEQIGPTDIREPILETLALLRAQFEQTRTAVHRDLGTSSLLVAVDPTQVKQLLLNLFLNAVEAMGHGGQLEIQGGSKQINNKPWVYVTVSDTGPGVPDAIRSKIFEPFFSTKARGSGLGLAICRSIIDAHRGTITVQPRDRGQGTSVVVSFPAASRMRGVSSEPVLSA
ncbi:MAG TPA: ATP-binding protein [Candidatus Binatia bacterium]|nr:ATP-binding protein [Candidatus Binatia bacterium]